MVDSVADLARGSDVLISCLFSDAQLRETGLGPDGFIANAKPGLVFVSHTTGTLSTLEALRDASAAAPVILDAPVSGTVENIDAGTLTVLIGGPSDAVASVTPILAAYADPVVATGALGSALALKLINNLLFAANAQLLGCGNATGRQLSVEPNVLLSTLQVCSARSHAADQAQRIGGMDRFAELAGAVPAQGHRGVPRGRGRGGCGTGIVGHRRPGGARWPWTSTRRLRGAER